MPDASETIKIYNQSLLSEKDTLTQFKTVEYVNNNPINFTSEELNKIAPELYQILSDLLSKDLKFRIMAVLTLGYFESFSIKVTKGLVNYELIEKTCSKAFCAQVSILHPLISIYRSENDSLYFTTMTHLFNKWKFSNVSEKVNQKD